LLKKSYYKKGNDTNNTPWKGKYSEVDYIDSQGFATVHHNEFFNGLLGEINEEVTVSDRRNDYSKCLVFQAADMNNDMVFHDTSRHAVNKEVLLDNGRNGSDDCVVSQDATRNNELMHSETSKREENKEAMVDMEFHDTSSNAVNEEVLIVDRSNGGDD
jgi:hypothetical protein